MGGVEFGFDVLGSGLVTSRRTRRAALSLSSRGGGCVGFIILGSGVSRTPVTAMQTSRVALGLSSRGGCWVLLERR